MLVLWINEKKRLLNSVVWDLVKLNNSVYRKHVWLYRIIKIYFNSISFISDLLYVIFRFEWSATKRDFFDFYVDFYNNIQQIWKENYKRILSIEATILSSSYVDEKEFFNNFEKLKESIVALNSHMMAFVIIYYKRFFNFVLVDIMVILILITVYLLIRQ